MNSKYVSLRMKNWFKSFLRRWSLSAAAACSVVVLLGCTGCQTPTSSTSTKVLTNIDTAVKFLGPLLATADEIAVNSAVKNPSHKQNIVNEELAAAKLIKTMATGQLSPDAVVQAMNSFNYGSDPTANLVVSSVFSLVSGFWNQYASDLKGNPALAADILSHIADDVTAGASNLQSSSVQQLQQKLAKFSLQRK